MRAAKRGNGRITPKGTAPSGKPGTKAKSTSPRPVGFVTPSRNQVRGSQHRPLPPRRGARGNR